MEYIECFDAVEGVVNEATKQYSSRYTLNKELYDKLADICYEVDELLGEIECLCLDVSVYDTSPKRVAIEIICDGMILQHGREHTFFHVIQMFDSFSFSKSKDGNVCISLNLDKMWVRKPTEKLKGGKKPRPTILGTDT